MQDYVLPLADMTFVLDRVLDLPGLLTSPRFEGIDPDTVHAALEEAGRLIRDVTGPLNPVGDRQGSHLQPDGTVRTPDGWKDAYDKLAEAGWGALTFSPDYGGGGFPEAVGMAIQEMMISNNMAFSMCALLTQGAIHAIESVADETIVETYLRRIVTGEWTGTMNLTEPEAGSDVGALRSKAEPAGDGSYLITGQKIFITYGDHDLTENIVHLVLARTPDAPPGTKGISCFIVPKFRVNPDGTLGEPNDVRCVSVEHKMGIHASPTCVMAFGDEGDCRGWLLGNEFDGMRVMFVMMNMARLGVGIQGLGLAERATQAATAYARERRQGRAPGAPKGESSPIVDHPDVRRMLMTMRCQVEALRAVAYLNAICLDLAATAEDEGDRTRADELADLLIPITKGWGTDLGVEITSLAVQVFGGMGFIEETGIAQFYRDARIPPIYEGTNGIQAMDLVGRKIPMRAGGVLSDLWDQVRQTVTELAAQDDTADIGASLSTALGHWEEATSWIFENAASPAEVLAGATPYLRLAGVVTGGWMLARSALVARAWKDEGGDAAFCDQKVVTARFYAEQILPSTAGLAPQVTAGNATLAAASF